MKSNSVWPAPLALMAGLLALQLLAVAPARAQTAEDWRMLCSPGSEVEILVGSSWYRGIVIGPNTFGEAECGVLNTTYSGREMQFAMAPDRMRAIQSPGGTEATVAGTQQQGPDAGPLLDVQIDGPAPTQYRASLDGRPPLGHYVCRQYVTTIGWIDLAESSYAVNDVQGGYAFDPASGAIAFAGGAYAGWPARYEFSPAGAGHAHDENIIRITDESGGLKIDCFLTE